MKTISYKLSQVQEVAGRFAKEVASRQILAFIGDLGAGKTTFINAFLGHLGVQAPVISPTFTYVNVYQLPDGRQIYHFDLYRLKSLQEFEMAGFFEYFDQKNSLVIIEWPEIIMPMLSYHSMVKVNLEISAPGQRCMKYEIIN